jgi:hypothetical protein
VMSSVQLEYSRLVCGERFGVSIVTDSQMERCR